MLEVIYFNNTVLTGYRCLKELEQIRGRGEKHLHAKCTCNCYQYK